jgi:TnpA family transposase
MKGDYPKFQKSYSHEELIEHFLLDETEREFIAHQFRGDDKRHGGAILLKSLQYLGYFPREVGGIPKEIRLFIAEKLGLVEDLSMQYPWDSRTFGYHLASIRQYTGFRFPEAQDKMDLENWLRHESAFEAITSADLLECAIQRLRSLHIELPSENELNRIVNAALNGFFYDVYHRVTQRLNDEVRKNIDQLLIVPEGESVSPFEKLKAPAGPSGLKSLRIEIAKLQQLRFSDITYMGNMKEHLADVPFEVQKLLKRRATNETASKMREHSEEVCYGLMACFISIRTMEVIDDIVRMFVGMIHRIDVRAEKQRDKELLEDLKRVDGKTQILFRLAETIMENPDGTIRDIIFPVVKVETFHNLIAEKKASGPQYQYTHRRLMKEKYSRHYCRMLPLVLENLTFRSSNRFQPIIEALSVIKQHIRTSYKYFPVDVPVKGIITESWLSAVLENVGGKTRINRKYYEVCVLLQLEKALKCKEVWVEGSYAWRNPSEDLPPDWANEGKRASYYQKLNQPMSAQSFVENIRQEMMAALTEFNRILPGNPHVKIYTPGNSERGLFHVSKLNAQPDPPSIALVKEAVGERYGMLDLLDVFVEADRLVDFTRFFTHSGTKEIRSRDVLRPLLLLDLFAEGTNMGIKRMANTNPRYSYDELLYVRKTYFSAEALRNAIGAVVNEILHLRDPSIWGKGNACASDGKHFGVWDQNLMAEWRTRYEGYVVKVYWHVETNAVSIYSQLKNYSSSEAAAMIQGLIRHDTEMRVEKNFVDSHGQSEVAFAFCRLLNDFKLMPRLKRIKYERLYLPDIGMAPSFPNLANVLTRPIRLELIEQQYDEMMKATVAMRYRYATAEAILRRHSSDNTTHPTYKALIELGKAEKTIFLCNYLPYLEPKQETQAGLNVIENWNGTNDFIFYGRRGRFETNDPQDMEISMLSLHLLQNCLILVNTLLLERTIEEHSMLEKLSPEDMRALTPLFHEHVNPYGLFELDLNKASFLEVI